MKRRIHPLAAAIAVAFSSAAVAQNTPALGEIVVTAERQKELPEPAQLDHQRILPISAATSDTASLLQDVPGVSLYSAGGISSLPVIHGLADDRLRATVDGFDLIAACPNHMNPPLSYIDPSAVARIKVYAGITPVSVGGDSIGGSIVVETANPQFAAPGQALLTKGEIGASGRTNNHAVAGHVAATAVTENFSISYTGAAAQADNYKAGGNFKSTAATGRPGHTLALDEVGSTAYESYTHLLGLAYRNGNHLFEAKAGYQDIPYQLYPNQRMDMLGNEQTRFSLRYLGQYDWGFLEARVYHENVDHYMNFGPDKQLVYNTAVNGMPMYTHGQTTGATVKADIDLDKNNLLRVGGIYQHYVLDDWWPASGTGGMSPNTFQNINNGQRDRAGVFGEWESRLTPQWTTLLGARYEHVVSDADNVQGYNSSTNGGGMMMNWQQRDTTAFNAADHRRTDNNVDLTALARYAANANSDVEFGVARKVRSPNLYERYTWSTWGMAAVMNNYVGDGNGYVGNLDLKPETAYTASTTFGWHAADRRWELSATPFYTHVDNYIDAVQWNPTTNAAAATPATGRYVTLKYTNQSARIYGLDLAGHAPLAKTGLGEFGVKGLLNYVRGENRDTGGNLYNIMPLNAKLTLTHETGGWSNAVEFVSVLGKHDVSAVRNEVETSGYSLTHLRSSYTWKNVRVDFGVENLFDKYYALPLGGAYTAQGRTMSQNPTDGIMSWGTVVPGMGRTLYAGVNVKF